MKVMAYLSVLMVLTPVSTLCVISFAMWRTLRSYTLMWWLMNNGFSWSALFMSGVTFLISLFRPEEWMVIGIMVGIVGTVFTCWANWYYRRKFFQLQRNRWQRPRR